MKTLRRDDRRHPAGFTLIEVLVVVAILALIAQLVVANIGAMVPRTVLDSTANQLMARLEFLRTEAMLQGKTYTLELDIDNERYRVVLPPEERLVSTQTIEESGIELDWTYLDERVDLFEHRYTLGPVRRNGRLKIEFDANGFTSDQLLAMRMKGDELSNMVWTIQIRGLRRANDLFTSYEGQIADMEAVDESSGF